MLGARGEAFHDRRNVPGLLRAVVAVDECGADGGQRDAFAGRLPIVVVGTLMRARAIAQEATAAAPARGSAPAPATGQITQLIALGFGTADMPTELYLSAHTVRDYVKAIFEKVGVSSRGELVAKLFAEHFSPVHFELENVDRLNPS